MELFNDGRHRLCRDVEVVRGRRRHALLQDATRDARYPMHVRDACQYENTRRYKKQGALTPSPSVRTCCPCRAVWQLGSWLSDLPNGGRPIV